VRAAHRARSGAAGFAQGVALQLVNGSEPPRLWDSPYSEGPIMECFAEKVQKAAFDWQQSGRKTELLWTGMTAALADLWAYHHEQQGDPAITKELAAFITASMERIDIDAVWGQRRNCAGCGERYKLENMSTCIECSKTLCWRCSLPYASGNSRLISYTCPNCGGEMY